MKEFFKKSLRTSVAIFLALIGLAIAIGIFYWGKEAYERQQAKPFEEVRDWGFDLKDSLGVQTLARTKMVEGTLWASVEVIGYSKYFSDPRNVNGSLNFEFQDKDGFGIVSRPVKLSDFRTIVGKNGENAGLSYQFVEYTGLDKYKRFNRMQVGWNLFTDAPPQVADQKPVLDHCAPNISKSERLKRLAQHGAVRETGTGSYSAAGHSVHFFYDGTLLNCY